MKNSRSEPSRGVVAALIRLLGSYGLSCLCLFCLFILTILGTLYQVDHGLHEAKQIYFNSFFLWADIGGVRIPVFPAGILCMGVLSLNLVVGGIVRMRKNDRTLGILVIHLGVAFMLIASLVKLVSSNEGHLVFYEGETTDMYASTTDWEVAVWDASGAPGGAVTEVVIEDRFLRDLVDGKTRSFELPGVPFELVLSNFVEHCDPLPKGPAWEAASPVVDGYALLEREPPKEVEFRVAGLHAQVVGEPDQEALLWGMERLPWTVQADGKTFAVSMRHAREKMPFALRLDDFQKEDHPGTGMAKSYRSYVYKLEDGVEERILIEMNEPLRSDGLVLFQTNWGPQSPGPHPRMYSVLTVVRNPSDKWPEYALWVITAGMLFDFGRKLFRFLSRMKRKAATAAGGAA